MFLIIFVCLSSIYPSFSEVIPLKIDFSYRFSINPNQFQCFSICQKDLKPSSSYDIKISFLGSVFFFQNIIIYLKAMDFEFEKSKDLILKLYGEIQNDKK